MLLGIPSTDRGSAAASSSAICILESIESWKIRVFGMSESLLTLQGISFSNGPFPSPSTGATTMLMLLRRVVRLYRTVGYWRFAAACTHPPTFGVTVAEVHMTGMRLNTSRQSWPWTGVKPDDGRQRTGIFRFV